MKNQAQGTITLYLVKNTDMDEEEFYLKLHEKNIVSANVNLTTSDGVVHSVNLADILNLQWDTFDSLEDKEEIKKPLSCELSDKKVI